MPETEEIKASNKRINVFRGKGSKDYPDYSQDWNELMKAVEVIRAKSFSFFLRMKFEDDINVAGFLELTTKGTYGQTVATEADSAINAVYGAVLKTLDYIEGKKGE
jgi:hypothetical protein